MRPGHELEGLEDRTLLSGVARFRVSVPPGDFANVSSLVPGPNGNVWFDLTLTLADSSTTTQVDQITPAGHVSTVVTLPATLTIINQVAGPGGNLWFSGSQQGSTSQTIQGAVLGRIDSSGSVDVYPLGNDYTVENLITTQSGGLAFMASSSNSAVLGRVTPDGQISETPLPGPAGDYLNDSLNTGLAEDHLGNLWVEVSYLNTSDFTSNSLLERITPAGQVTTVTIPQARVLASQGVKSYEVSPSINGMTTGPDGNVWFTEGEDSSSVPRSIARVTPSGKLTTYRVFASGVNGDPAQIIAGPNHKLFFSVGDTNFDIPEPQFELGVITTAGQVSISHFPHKVDSDGNFVGVDPSSLTIGQDGNLWFSNDVSSFNGGSITEIDRLTLAGAHRHS